MSRITKSKNRLCPVCSGDSISQFMTIQDVPIYCNVLCSTVEEAVNAPKGDIVLTYCRQCGHIYNSAYNSDKMNYSQDYENSLHYSPRFQEYALSLAKRLVETYDLHAKRVLEIGCGKGDFLNMLCEFGENSGIGFDPSYDKDRFSADSHKRFSVINDFYSEKYSEYKADLIVCRQALEHIESPRNFLKMLRQSIGSNGNNIVFFEVPNVMFTLKELGIWDLIYEHCGYFSTSSISYLFKVEGFEVLHLTCEFQEQFINIEALAIGRDSNFNEDCWEALDKMTDSVTDFSELYQQKIEEWHLNLEKMTQTGKKAVIWGAGSKGITFLNVLGVGNQIAYVVDINPHKQGMYVGGTGHKIVPATFLIEYRPDTIIVMNPIYFEEIQKTTRLMGLAPNIVLA